MRIIFFVRNPRSKVAKEISCFTTRLLLAQVISFGCSRTAHFSRYVSQIRANKIKTAFQISRMRFFVTPTGFKPVTF